MIGRQNKVILVTILAAVTTTVLIVGAIGGTVYWSASREAQRRERCMQNLKCIQMAVENYMRNQQPPLKPSAIAPLPPEKNEVK